MIGFLRFGLALAVIAYHLDPTTFVFAGPLAVFGFYTVSGYLISRLLTGRYSGDLGRYFLNRALRIYPCYWAAAGLGLALAAWATPLPALEGIIAIPQTVPDVIRQVTIFGLLGVDLTPNTVRLVPSAWSLNMELAYYVAMVPLVRVLPVWFVASVAMALLISLFGNWQHAYWSYHGPSLAFATGAMVHGTSLRLGAAHVPLALGALLAMMALPHFVEPSALLLYGAAGATAYFIASADIRLKNRRWASFDRWLGKLSYPMFLSHWIVASLVASLAGTPRGHSLLLLTLAPLLCLSVVFVLVVEHPVERIRGRIRPESVPRPSVEERDSALARTVATVSARN